VVAALHPAEKNYGQKSSYLDYTTVLNLKDIEFPINVYCIEKKKELSILPIWLTEKNMDKHINLLYVQNDDVGHFA